MMAVLEESNSQQFKCNKSNKKEIIMKNLPGRSRFQLEKNGRIIK